MKKFYILLGCFLLLACTLQAQSFNAPDFAHRPQRAQTSDPIFDPEKIYLFDVDIEVHTDGNIQVTERITLNAKHQQINRGIYRELPVSLTEQVRPLSLIMDGQPHPFFTEKRPHRLRVNFGNDNFISTGKHTYVFTYSYTGAINFLKNYDELYWNVTGNDWNFSIDKARVRVSFPSNVEIQKSGISFYTGAEYSKEQHAEQTESLTFETTVPLLSHEGFTIAIPFDKGAILPPPLSARIESLLFSLPCWIAVLLFIYLMKYCISSWRKIGRDPVYMAIAQYEPPRDISPAFTYYFYNRITDAKALSCAILDLAMKGYLEIQEGKGFFAKTTLLQKKSNVSNLPYEEERIMRRLFSSGEECVLDTKTGEKLESLRKEIDVKFSRELKKYIVSNTTYALKAAGLGLALGILPFIFFLNSSLIFINLHFAIFFLALAAFVFKSPLSKIVIGLLITGFYSMFWVAESGVLDSLAILFCQSLYLIGMWSIALYTTLIANVTPEGRDLWEQLDGFKKYVKTADVHRVAASNPNEAERIFCDYLPFAFALGLYNQWMKKFTKVLSQATMDQCMQCAGGAHTVSRGLSSSVGSSMPSGGRGGSHGGGHSGGGHGGGGGGGR